MGDLGATYDDHLKLITKRVVDFLLALIELFSLGVTAVSYTHLRAHETDSYLVAFRSYRSLFKFRSNAVTLTQNFRYKGLPPTNHFCTVS